MKALVGAFNQEKVLDCENRWIVWSSSITGLVLVTVLSCSCVSGRTPLGLVRFMTGRYWAATASLCRLRWPLLQPGTQGGAPDTHSSDLICTPWQTQFERSVRIRCITRRVKSQACCLELPQVSLATSSTGRQIVWRWSSGKAEEWCRETSPTSMSRKQLEIWSSEHLLCKPHHSPLQIDA